MHLVWEKDCGNGKFPNRIKRGSFWWRDILKLLDKYKGMSAVSLMGDGKSCYLWSDLWDGQVPSQAYPQLFSFARNKHITILAAKAIGALRPILSFASVNRGICSVAWHASQAWKHCQN